MQEKIKHWDYFKRAFLSIPLCLSLAQADLKDFPQDNFNQIQYSMQAHEQEQKICELACLWAGKASKLLMTHAKDLSQDDKALLFVINRFIQTDLLPATKEQGDIYYATLGLSQIITSVLDDVFMDLIGYDLDFIDNFDAITYGKEAKRAKGELGYA